MMGANRTQRSGARNDRWMSCSVSGAAAIATAGINWA
jgi:hypothetical protein